MNAKTILITGASGCVGHYLVEELLASPAGHRLVLILRDPAKLAIRAEWRDRVSIIEADMADIERFRDRLAGIDAAVLVATSWGEGTAFRINCEANTALADALISAGCRQIVYFSSASVLDRHGELLAPARDLGTEYIQSKYRLVELMEERAGSASITGIFPTLVIGGGADGKPLSHLARLLFQVRRWAFLLRRLRADGRFHVIHARDIARVTQAVLEDGDAPARLVLGLPARSVNETVADYLAYLGKRPGLSVELRESLAEWFIRVFRIELSPWDRYCMHHRDLSFEKAVTPADFGRQSHAPDLAAALASIGLPGRGERAKG